MKRRLAAILAADVEGYSRLMGADEAGTLSALNSYRKELIEPKVRQYGGRIVKLMGDGALMEFPSAVEAVACAVEFQCAMTERTKDIPDHRRIAYRVGINVGDIIIENDDIFGEGVNIAARLESLAEPGGICIANNVVDQVNGKLDLAFELLGEREVKNISRPVTVHRVVMDEKARRLVTEIRESAPLHKRRQAYAIIVLALLMVAGGLGWWQPWNTGASPAPDNTSLALMDKPSIAVLPFTNMSDDKAREYFSDGITEDLITDLSRISGLVVIARNSSFAYKGRAVDLRDIGRELDVRYVVEGSVQKADQKIRITAQLIDARSGAHVWADRFDRELKDVFALQDDVVSKIVSALSVKLRPSEKQLLTGSTEAQPEAYDMLLRGLEMYRRFTPDSIEGSRQYFERAVAFDPTYARAYAALALTYIMPVEQGFSENPEKSKEEAYRLALEAQSIDAKVREVQFALGIILRVQGKYREAIEAARNAIEIDGNYADGYALLAINLNFADKPREGLVAIEKGIRLNPRKPSFYMWILAQSHYLLGQYSEAAQILENIKEKDPDFMLTHKLLAATYSALGRHDDAEWAVSELEILVPNISLEQESISFTYENPDVKQTYIERLRDAGLR